MFRSVFVTLSDNVIWGEKNELDFRLEWGEERESCLGINIFFYKPAGF